MPHRFSACALAVTALVVLAGAPGRARAEAGSCASLRQARLPGAEVVSAETAAGTLPTADLMPLPGPGGAPVDPALRDLPPFCRVFASLSPVPGSHIGVELWMPRKWNGKLLGLGNHGFAGEFEHGDMALGLHRGYAVVTTDGGHRGQPSAQGGFSIGGTAFARDPVAVEDFAWRSTHEMTVAAKRLVELYYGTKARRAYFDGCSNGGRQAMREVQQFPADYDGVIAGSAAMNWTGFMASDLWSFQSGTLAGGARMSLPKLKLAGEAEIAACDGDDGLKDGLLADPARCRWSPRALLCAPGVASTDGCLLPDEAAAVERARAPLRRPLTGKVVYDGFAAGSEAAWESPLGNMAAPNLVTAGYYRDMVGAPDWSDPHADLMRLLDRSQRPGSPGALLDTVNPDIAAFRDRGGRLIQYHGWNDPAMAPGAAVRYYGEVVDLQPGPDKVAATQGFYRLFMAPGMGHCFGGAAPVNFGGLSQHPSPVADADHDLLEALDRWVEQGRPPARVIATQFAGINGSRGRQMPLCPWPQVARYGGGDPDRASSFQCRAPVDKPSGGVSAPHSGVG